MKDLEVENKSVAPYSSKRDSRRSRVVEDNVSFLPSAALGSNENHEE